MNHRNLYQIQLKLISSNDYTINIKHAKIKSQYQRWIYNTIPKLSNLKQEIRSNKEANMQSCVHNKIKEL